jgi:hypothetical protein
MVKRLLELRLFREAGRNRVGDPVYGLDTERLQELGEEWEAGRLDVLDEECVRFALNTHNKQERTGLYVGRRKVFNDEEGEED